LQLIGQSVATRADYLGTMAPSARRAPAWVSQAFCIAGLARGQTVFRAVQPGEVVGKVVEYHGSGQPIAGYTTWEVSIFVSGDIKNCFTFAGEDDHPTIIPPARQVAAPFGANFGGTNPLYLAYNAECEYDSWLTGVSRAGPWHVHS
jgi:hypothetical protein